MTDGGELTLVTEDLTLDAFADEEASGSDVIHTTYEWRPEGGVCESCGDVAEARWREGEHLVCASCKSWSG